MPLPSIPSTHRWVDGGLVAAVAGRALTVPSADARIYVWDLDTDARVVDLYDGNGNVAETLPLTDNTFRGGIPKSVVRPVFSVGANGLRFAGNDWEAVANAKAAADDAAAAAALVGAPADTAIAAAVTGPGTATKAALDGAYGSKATQDQHSDDIASLKVSGPINKADRADVPDGYLIDIDPARLRGPVSATSLVVPTHVTPAGGQLTHPSIVYVPGGRSGYRYWMAMTPYPSGNDDHEDPNIVASNDGISWEVPPGVTNPLDDATGQPAYNSDVCLTLGPDGRFYLFYRFYDTNAVGAEETIFLRTSEDGIAWSERALVWQNNQATRRPVAPSVFWDGTQWVMYAVDLVPSPNRLFRTTAPSPTGPWATPVDCTVSPLISGKEPWHVEVRFIGGRYIGLLNDTTVDTNGNNGELIFIESHDGLTFTGSSTSAIPKSQSGKHDNLYKSSFIPGFDAKGDFGFHVWYVGWLTGPPAVWNLYKTFVKYEAPTGYPKDQGATYSQAQVTAGGSLNTPITFPTPFAPGASPRVFINPGSGRLNVIATSVTNTGFTVNASNFTAANSSAGTGYWYAVVEG